MSVAAVRGGSRWLAIIATVLLLAATLAGCSALRLGYSQGREIAYWWLDAYVDFDSMQARRVRQALDQWFAWHRSTQLRDYADQLARAQTEVVADTTPARVCEWGRALSRRARVAFDQAVPAIADIATTLDVEQIANIERRYAAKNDEYRDDFLQSDAKKRSEATLKRALDRIESIYGRLDERQRTQVAEQLARSPFDPERWLAERMVRQQEALRLLRRLTAAPPPRAEAEQWLRSYGDTIERSPREAYRRYADRLTDFNCAFAADLHNRTTAEQRSHAAKKLAGWEGDLRSLADPGVADRY